jgi:hypothetical protein
MRDQVVESEGGTSPLSSVHEQLAETQRNLARAQEALESIQSSPSWKLTAPLRRLKHAVRDR